jgi:hypothetical protein
MQRIHSLALAATEEISLPSKAGEALR